MTRPSLGASVCLLAACWLMACSRDVATGTRCGNDDACAAGPRAGAGTAGGSDEPTAPSPGAGRSDSIDRSDEALSVRAQNIEQMTIEIGGNGLGCLGSPRWSRIGFRAAPSSRPLMT